MKLWHQKLRMTIGVFKETFGNKVGLVPSVIKKLIKRGYSVPVEAKAGRKTYMATAEFISHILNLIYKRVSSKLKE